jgi:protein tyrosine phosphatase
MGNSLRKQKQSLLGDDRTTDYEPWVAALREAEVLDWKNGLDEEEILQVVESQDRITQQPIPIDDILWIGSTQSVQDVTVLRSLGISHVLNMAGSLAAGPIDTYKEHGIAYLQMDAEDEISYPLLSNHLQVARAFIARARANHSGCVVHCQAGLNRSGTILAAERMLTNQVPVLQVVKELRKARGNLAVTNEGFQKQLVSLAAKHDLLGPLPDFGSSTLPRGAT